MHTTYKITLYDKKRSKKIKNNVSIVLPIQVLDS